MAFNKPELNKFGTKQWLPFFLSNLKRNYYHFFVAVNFAENISDETWRKGTTHAFFFKLLRVLLAKYKIKINNEYIAFKTGYSDFRLILIFNT